MIAELLTAECLAEHASSGPRYTSYPPATQFAALGPAVVAEELAIIRAAGGPASLYIHVPFCRSLCWYCGCNVIPTRDASRGDAYVDVLTTELALLAGKLGADFPISELALGGGSPNFLSTTALRVLMEAVRRYFKVLPDARMSVELDPRTTSTSHLEAFAAAGFRSMSIGVQDFSEQVQDAIHRHQTVVQTRWLVERARAAGFDDVNLDIVYGLPRQDEESFGTTVDTVLSLAPDRVALFGYAHLPSKLPHQLLVERAGRILDSYERASLLLMAIDKFTAAGYVHLGLDHFARPDSRLAKAAAEHRMARTFQGYVERRSDTILGVGVTAITSTPRAFWQNKGDLGAWEQSIHDRVLPAERGLVLDRDDQIRRTVIGQLMCEGTLAFSEIEREFGIDMPTYFPAELAAVAAQAELASVDPAAREIHTTPLGKLLVRNVCMAFDRYLARDHVGEAPKFSSTI
jgi:oxygen-independent coproporphyrinogen-3 oxidase